MLETLPHITARSVISAILTLITGVVGTWLVLSVILETPFSTDAGVDATGAPPTVILGVAPQHVVHQVVNLTVKLSPTEPTQMTTEEYWVLIGESGETEKFRVISRDTSGTIVQESFYDSTDGRLYNHLANLSEIEESLIVSQRQGMSPLVEASELSIEALLADGYQVEPVSQSALDPVSQSALDMVSLSGSEPDPAGRRLVSKQISLALGIEAGNSTVVQSPLGEVLFQYDRDVTLLEILAPGSYPTGTFDWSPPRGIRTFQEGQR